MKIFVQASPLAQLTCNNSFTFWCIKDSSLRGNVVLLNLSFAEQIGFKSGTEVL